MSEPEYILKVEAKGFLDRLDADKKEREVTDDIRVLVGVTGIMKLPLIKMKTSAGATGLVWEIKSSVMDICMSCVLVVVCW